MDDDDRQQSTSDKLIHHVKLDSHSKNDQYISNNVMNVMQKSQDREMYVIETFTYLPGHLHSDSTVIL